MPVFSSLAVPADTAPSPLPDFPAVRRTFTHSLLHLSAVPHAGETETEGTWAPSSESEGQTCKRTVDKRHLGLAGPRGESGG